MTQGDSKRDSSNKELEKKRKQAAKAAARSHKEREKKAKKKEKAGSHTREEPFCGYPGNARQQ